MLIVDPSKLSVSDLTGLERVGVVNRNIGEKVCYTHITGSGPLLSLACECVLFIGIVCCICINHIFLLFASLSVE